MLFIDTFAVQYTQEKTQRKKKERDKTHGHGQQCEDCRVGRRVGGGRERYGGRDDEQRRLD